MISKHYFWLGGFLLMFIHCEVKNDQAAFLILQPTFVTTSGQGPPLQQFSEYYLYVNQSFHGAFLPGVSIPVLANQPVTVQILPGIRENGISSEPMAYNLVAPWEDQVNLTLGQETILRPIFSYKSNARLRWIEDFEDRNHLLTLDLDQDSLTFCRRSDQADTLSGYYGEIRLTRSHPYVFLAQALPTNAVPTDGRPVFLEMHYQSGIEFRIGLQGSNGGSQAVNRIKLAIRPRASWNRIYVNFTPDVQVSDFPSYRVIFEAQLPEGLAEAKIYLDNLRFLHL